MKRPFTIMVLGVALTASGVGAAPARADHDDHHCPSGFEAKRTETRRERTKDRNGDGTVCVKETEDGTEIKDDTH